MAFALVVILMPPYIRLLQGFGFGKRIRQEGPESHFSKEGTPTMGGLLIVLVVLGIYFFLRQPDAATFAPLAALAGVGALGAFDDYLNARTGEGIKARQKLIWLTVVAFVAAYQIQQTYAITAIAVPFYGPLPIEPWLYVGFAAFAIIAAANGVNITDGLDGLSGGTVAIAFVAYMLIALPVGAVLGYALSAAIVQTVQSEVYRFPLFISRQAVAWSYLGIIAAAFISALLVRRRLDTLDLVAVLKVRE